MNILLLEDDVEAREHLAQGLRHAGHEVRCAHDGNAALEDIEAGGFDLLILDRMVPELDGLSVLRRARAAGCTAPALMLTALARVGDRIDGLDAGADDYMSKPFAFEELAARVNALARRPPISLAIGILRVGDVELNLLQRKVTRGGVRIELQTREFSLLAQLMLHAGEVVPRTVLLERVWSLGFDPKTNIVDSHISRLRTKLQGQRQEAPLIRAVRGVGYIMTTDAD